MPETALRAETARGLRDSRGELGRRRRGLRPVGVIVDSCIWVGLAAGQVEPQVVIDTAGNAPVFISAISLGELGFGVQVCADPAERARRAAHLRQLERRPVLDIGRHTAAAFGVLAAAVKQAGRSPRPRYPRSLVPAGPAGSSSGPLASRRHMHQIQAVWGQRPDGAPRIISRG